MLGHKLKHKLLATAAALVVGISAPAVHAAGILDGWNLNLSVANGVMHSGGGSFTGMANITGIDHLVINGESVIEQTVTGGTAVGNPFTDNGFLNILGKVPEGGGAFVPTILHLNPVTNGLAMTLFFEFSGLAGTLNLDESITFTPGSGTVKLWLENDADSNSTTGDVLELAEFRIIAPSGGSDLDFHGGGGANATIDVTLEQLSGLVGLYTDSANNPLPPSPLTLHLGNMDSFLNPNETPNPDNTGIDGMGNGESVIHVQNSGQYNVETISQVPEPGSLAALGFGLIAFASMASRRQRKAA